MAFSPTTTMAHQCKALQDLTTSVQRLAELFPGHGLLPVAQGSNTKGGSKEKGLRGVGEGEGVGGKGGEGAGGGGGC